MTTAAPGSAPSDLGPSVELSTRVRRVARRVTLFDAVFFIVAVFVGYQRYRVLAMGGAPPTIDTGNWLAYGDEILGHGVRSTSIVYPPVVPLLSKAAVGLFGLTAGVSGLAAMAAVAPATGTYLVLRRLVPHAAALPPAMLLLGASSIGEATAWGGFPQLIGFCLTPIVLFLLDRLLRTWEQRTALATGLTLMTLLATSHFVGATVVIATLVMVGLAAGKPIVQRPPLRTLGTCAALVIVPSVWLAPLYLTFFQAAGGVSTEFKFFTELTWPNLGGRIEFLYRDLAWVWRILLPTTILAPILFWRSHRTTLWRVTTSLLVAVVATTLAAREARSLYFLIPIAALGLALWTVQLPAWLAAREHVGSPRWNTNRARTMALTALLVLGTIQIRAGLEFFEPQRAYYGFLTPDLVTGLEMVHDTTDPDTVIAIPSLRDGPLGWWAEAIARRETLYGTPTRWLLFDDELRRATIANALFVPPFPTAEKVDQAAAAGVDLMLVPTDWVFYRETQFSDFAAANPGAVEYLTPGLVSIRTDLTGD